MRENLNGSSKMIFFAMNVPLLNTAAATLYIVTLVAYTMKEVVQWKRTGTFNIPKNLLLFGTAFSWFVGIVAFNNDLAFTATNVIAHGVPYLALIWLYGHNQTAIQGTKTTYLWPWVTKLFQWKTVPFYVATLLVIAFVEEGFWDGFVWRDHGMLFWFSNGLPAISDAHTLMWLVPLLALPQATHYILDAFIWRMTTEGTPWKRFFISSDSRNSMTKFVNPGRHLLIDFWDAKHLQNAAVIERAMREAAHACGATVLEIKLHSFGGKCWNHWRCHSR